MFPMVVSEVCQVADRDVGSMLTVATDKVQKLAMPGLKTCGRLDISQYV